MFIVDTNVISELRRSERADPNVLAWATATPAQELYLSVATILEIERGALIRERRDPRQGAVLRRWIEQQILVRFHGRILPIDTAVARCSARLHVPDPRPERDALIAATALVHGMSVVTRNTADFVPMGVTVVDPWKS